jgi:dTDP-4-dehydrorhamnose 3,5-epimerase
VAVDLRPNSPTYKKHFSLELSDQNHRLLWIPDGFAHGFFVLGNEAADLLYKVTDFYDPKREKGIRWNDPILAIEWPNKNPILSPRDAALPFWMEE